ncbi:MAG: TonB-dependent receptor [Candidatus Marinimicrobia bacterium]|nr:TonB-dependent receptor [Candidatus Neomarinimicrobiota bacterium]
MKILIIVFIVTFVFFRFSFSENESGGIVGTIVDDETQSPIAGVNVFVKGDSIGTITDENGFYRLLNLTPGMYNVSFQIIGYRTIEKLNIPVALGRQTQMDIRMSRVVLSGKEVVVKSSAFAKLGDPVPSDKNMDYTEMINDPGSMMDVPRMMQALPSVISGADQENEIIVRGGNPGENLFLLDGIEIPNPNHYGNQGAGGGPISMINPFFINDIDFYAGAFPAKYGGKLSSVMDIHLKEGNKEERNFSFDMGMSGIGMLSEGPIIKDRITYIFGIHKSYLEYIIGNFGMTAIPKYWNAQWKVIYYISPRAKIIWNGLLGDEKIYIDYSKETIPSGTDIVDVKSGKYATGITFKSLLSKNSFMDVTLSNVKDYWKWDVFNLNNNKKYKTFQKRDAEGEWTLKGDYTCKINDFNTLSAGFNLKLINFYHKDWSSADTIYSYYYHPYGNPYDTTFYYDANGFYSASPDTYSIYRVERIFDEWGINNDIDTRSYAAYLQHKLILFDRLTILMGLRLSQFEYNNSNAISPRLGISYRIISSTYINAGYGKHFQQPAYFNFSINPEKNRSLKPEICEQYIFGLEHLFSNTFKGNIEIYYKKYYNLATNRAWVERDSLSNYNFEKLSKGKGYSKGIELFLQKKLSKSFNFTLSYSHYISKRLDLRRKEVAYYTSSYDFRNVFTFIVGYKIVMLRYSWYLDLNNRFWWKPIAWLLDPGNELEIGIRWRYSDGKPYTKHSYNPYLRRWFITWSTDLNTERTPCYNRLDIMILRRWYTKKYSIVSYFHFINALNRKNIWDYYYTGDGKKGKIYQFSFMPVGGFVIEF